MEEVIEASKKAYIYDYINSLPNKFDFMVSEGEIIYLVDKGKDYQLQEYF